MTTTAHEDQFTAGTQTIQPVLQPYSTEAILRRNIADAKKEMQRQAERAESYAETLRSIASYVGAGGYNADTVDAGVFEEKIRWGIGELIGMLDRANAELAKLAQQKPVAWMDAEGDTYKEEPPENWCPPHVPLYASFAHAMHKGATHCDDCGLTWLDDGLNPLGCPYCKDAALSADSARIDWLADVNNTVGSVVLPRHIVEQNISSLRQAIDSAMTAKTAQEPTP